MNDRFLFRGKITGGPLNGEWIEGVLDYCETGYFIGNQATYPIQYMVDPETICQSTGLRDKNGRLIFEHDILEARLDVYFPEEVTRAEVVWTGFCWALKYHEGALDEMDGRDREIWEVVGNTIDPELLNA